MLLYICPTCGRWQDVSLTITIGNAFAVLAKAFNSEYETPEQLGYPCPAGHGLMIQVQPTERIFVKRDNVDKLLNSVFEQQDKDENE